MWGKAPAFCSWLSSYFTLHRHILKDIGDTRSEFCDERYRIQPSIRTSEIRLKKVHSTIMSVIRMKFLLKSISWTAHVHVNENERELIWQGSGSDFFALIRIWLFDMNPNPYRFKAVMCLKWYSSFIFTWFSSSVLPPLPNQQAYVVKFSLTDNFVGAH